MVYKFFDKNSASLRDKSGSGSGIVNNNNNNNNNNNKNNNNNNNSNNNNNNNEIKQNLQLAKELRKPIIRKFRKRKVKI